MLSKKIIFLTGATGTMGEEGLKQILSRSDRFNLRVLVRPSAKNKAFMSRYEHDAALEIVWGDLCCYDDILRCVTGADYVLHVGAFVSPEADKLPQRSLEVNLGSTMNIIRAIKAQPDPDAIKLVYIGTVAETGCRLSTGGVAEIPSRDLHLTITQSLKSPPRERSLSPGSSIG